MSIRRSAKRVLAAAVTAGLGALAAVVVATPAEAFCEGRGGGYTYTRHYNGHAIAQERQISGTCDQDGIYNGQLRDLYTDGYAARVWYWDGDFKGDYAYSSGGWVNYRWYDQDGDYGAIVELYSTPGSKGWTEGGSWGY